MKKLITLLGLAALLSAASASAQTYYKQVVIPAGDTNATIAASTTLNFVSTTDATFNTNMNLTRLTGTNVWFKIPDGKPLTLKVTQVATNASTANVTYTFAFSDDEFPGAGTTWGTLDTFSFTAALNGTSVVCVPTNLTQTIYGGARTCVLKSVANAHTAAITYRVSEGHY